MRLTRARAEQIADAYRSGTSIADLARQYNHHVNTITRVLTKAGLTIRRSHGIPDDQLQEARSLYNQGWTYKQIGTKYGTSRTTVSNQLNSRI